SPSVPPRSDFSPLTRAAPHDGCTQNPTFYDSVLQPGGTDEPVPGHEGGEVILGQLAGAIRPGREHHVPGLRGRVPDRVLRVVGQVKTDLGQHGARLPYRQ